MAKIILTTDVANLGGPGDVVEVKDGYARNFLLPRGLAVEASSKNLRMLEHHKRIIGVKAEREQKASQGVAAKLDGLALTVKAHAGEGGRLFGSVTNLDVERLLAEKGFHVDRRRIGLDEPLKNLGTFPIVVQVGRTARATIQLTVEAE